MGAWTHDESLFQSGSLTIRLYGLQAVIVQYKYNILI
jgi:hypothetical protein